MPPKIPPKKPTIAQPKEQARVLFSYSAENDDELTIKEGDIINVIDKEIEDKGWMKGKVNLFKVKTTKATFEFRNCFEVVQIS